MRIGMRSRGNRFWGGGGLNKTKNKILSKTFHFHKRQIVGGGGKGAGRGAQKGAKGFGWHGVPPNAPPRAIPTSLHMHIMFLRVKNVILLYQSP